MKKRVWILAPIIALLVGAVCFFAGGLKETSFGADYGNGVDIEGGAKFTLSSGTIKSSRPVDYGGGVSVTNGTFTMNGGTIEGNSATYGGGVYVGSSGTFTMTGGTIQNNTATSGSAIYISGGTFNYGGGTISGTIHTNTMININKKPTSPLSIIFDGINVGTRIAKLASGVTFSSSDYSLPSGFSTTTQTSGGTTYVVVQVTGIVVVAEGNGGIAGGTSLATFPTGKVGSTYTAGYGITYYYWDVGWNERYNGRPMNALTLYEFSKFLAEDDGYSGTFDGVAGEQRDPWFAVAVPNSGSRFVGFFVDGKPLDNSLPRSEKTFAPGTVITAKFESNYNTLSFVFNYSGSNYSGKVAGNGVEKVKGSGTSYGYYVYYKPGTKIRYLGGRIFVGDNEIQVYPPLGYYIYDLDMPSGSKDSEGYTTIYPTSNISCYVNCTNLHSNSPKLTVGCIGRQQLTRNEAIMIYGAIYAGSVANYNHTNKYDAPIIDAAYYDEYTTEEIYAAMQPYITLSSATTSNINNFWICVGDMLAAPKGTYIDSTTRTDWYSEQFIKNGPVSSISGVTAMPIGNEVSSVRGTEYNNGGYYVFWPNGASTTALFGENAPQKWGGRNIIIDNHTDDVFKIKDLLDYIEYQYRSNGADTGIDNVYYSDVSSSVGDAIVHDNWGNINCIICSLDVFANETAKCGGLLRAWLGRNYSPSTSVEPFMFAFWKSLAGCDLLTYQWDYILSYINAQFGGGSWVLSTGLFENAIYWGSSGSWGSWSYSTLSGNKGYTEDLVEGLRERWMPVSATDFHDHNNVVNQWFNIKTYFANSPGFRNVKFLEMTGDYTMDLRDANFAGRTFKADDNADAEIEENQPHEKEKDNLFFDNKKFYLYPIRVAARLRVAA